jgi:TRAP-type uncharacterized transport system fused permease subunit
VTVGSVAANMLNKIGYDKNAAWRTVSSRGIRGYYFAACFGCCSIFDRRFSEISYLDVLLMATIPTILFYLGLFVMVEIDVRKYSLHLQKIDAVDTAWNLTKKYWYHFSH